ncbi:myb-like protein X [Cydia fagiglandana]|uniref:myb-like protein X n=1 Tax=Cydia fagiglandana TaxID=1458189 RepID=UPI002FEE4D6F
MPNKYFIYAGGRWCEVDMRRGRVEGFRQRARFCYLRGGRLEVGRSATILQALRALAAGAGGAARDSAPLPHRRRHKRRESARTHRCCSQHRHHSRCDLNANELDDKETPLTVQALETSPRKRKRSPSEESHSKAKQIKSDEATQQTKSPQKKAVEDKEELIVKSLLEDSKENKSPPKKTVKVRAPEEEKLVQSLLASSSSEDIKEQIRSPKKPGPRSRKETQRSPQKLQKAKTVVRGKEEEKLVQSLLQTSSDDEQVPNKSKTSPISERVLSDSSTSSSEQKEMCKELVIDDHDVRVLRRFLARTVEAEDLKRFDKDEEYKTRVFYKLNPLVCLKRCGPLEKLLTQRLTLKEFARHLGLRSVADVTPEKRYRMRHSTRQARNTASITSDSEKEKANPGPSEKEKANAVPPKRRQLWNRNREMFSNSQSPLSSELKVKPQIHRPARNSSRDTTDSDTEAKQHIRRHLERRASAKLNPERKKTKDDDSIVVESDSDESSKSGNQRKTRRKSKGTADDDESMLVSDDNSSNADGNQRKTRRNSKGTKDDKKHVLVSDDNSSNADGNERKTRRKSKGTKEDKKCVLVGDDNSSNAEGNIRKTRRMSKGAKENNESVLVSDESDSVVVQKQRKSRSRTRAKSKTADDESVVISDESEQSDNKKSDSTNESAGLSTRRTRSQGPEKRVLREHNKSVIVSDSDSNAQRKRRTSRTKSKETNKRHGKSILVSDSNTDENQVKNVRTRSKDPNKDLQDIKANDRKEKKESDRRTEKDVVGSTETKKTTRSSMKITEDNSKENDKAKSSKKDEISRIIENTANKRKEKPGPSRRELKESPKKPERDNDRDKSEISDSSDAFETSKFSPKKNRENIKVGKLLTKRISAMNKPRNHKGKFIKQNPQNSENTNKINEKEKAEKANDDRVEKGGQKDKNKDKNRLDNETDKEKNKVLKDKIDRDRDEKERSKGSDDKKTENKGKENNRKAAAVSSVFVKPVKFKKSSVANGREYTSAEDHVIVAWISVGNRMRMVNGNAIWRELQSEYTRLTSQTRSWHSLRNRYLRYILPSLGQLALPPSQVSRLRAAAAVGKIKSQPRRNSIFKTQRVVSASTVGRIRFRAASDSDADSDKKAYNKSFCKWSTNAVTRPQKEAEKNRIQKELYERLGLKVDFVKQGLHYVSPRYFFLTLVVHKSRVNHVDDDDDDDILLSLTTGT